MTNTTPISESPGQLRQSPVSCRLLPMSLLPLWCQGNLGTLLSDLDLPHKEVWYFPFISKRWGHIKKTFPFLGYSDLKGLPLHCSVVLGLRGARGGSWPRSEVGRQAGRAAQVRQETGRAVHGTKPGHARLLGAAQGRSQRSIQGNISSSLVWYRWSCMLFGSECSSGIGRSATTKKLSNSMENLDTRIPWTSMRMMHLSPAVALKLSAKSILSPTVMHVPKETKKEGVSIWDWERTWLRKWDQVESDLGTLQRQIMSPRLYIINTHLKAKDRLFSLGRTRKPVQHAGCWHWDCFHWYSQTIKVTSVITTWLCTPIKQKT